MPMGSRSLSPLAQGRGLKLAQYKNVIVLDTVAPRAGAWIETRLPTLVLNAPWSPLAQGRGLKHLNSAPSILRRWSPLAQGRGLKRERYNNTPAPGLVAPRAGAWIET